MSTSPNMSQRSSDQSNDSAPVVAAPAGLLRRAGALIYDGLLIVAIWMVLALIVVVLNNGEAVAGWIMQLIFVIETCAFYAYFWVKRGQTLGMRAWRLQLVDSQGLPVTLTAVAKRMLIGPFSLLVLGLGYLWYFIGTRQQTWHDRFSDTFVVLLPETQTAKH